MERFLSSASQNPNKAEIIWPMTSATSTKAMTPQSTPPPATIPLPPTVPAMAALPDDETAVFVEAPAAWAAWLACAWLTPLTLAAFAFFAPWALVLLVAFALAPDPLEPPEAEWAPFAFLSRMAAIARFAPRPVS